jgi:hypothetical protein
MQYSQWVSRGDASSERGGPALSSGWAPASRSSEPDLTRGLVHRRISRVMTTTRPSIRGSRWPCGELGGQLEIIDNEGQSHLDLGSDMAAVAMAGSLCCMVGEGD